MVMFLLDPSRTLVAKNPSKRRPWVVVVERLTIERKATSVEARPRCASGRVDERVGVPNFPSVVAVSRSAIAVPIELPEPKPPLNERRSIFQSTYIP
jgi:hypothetical protein